MQSELICNLGTFRKSFSLILNLLGQSDDGTYYIITFGLAYEKATREQRALQAEHFHRLIITISEE